MNSRPLLRAAALLLPFCFGAADAFAQNAISTGTRAGFRMYYPNSNDWWLDPSSGRFDIRANGGAPLAALNSLGNLGIGTTAPGYKLDIQGASGLRIGSGTYDSNLVLGNGGAVWQSGIRTFDNGHAEMRIWHANAAGHIYLTTGYNGDQAGTLPTDGLQVSHNLVGIGVASRIESGAKLQVVGGAALGNSYIGANPGDGSLIASGSVGIGTASPSAKLHVSAGDILLENGQALRSGIVEGAGLIGRASGSGAAISLGSGQTGDFLVFNAGGVERARLTTAGNVGIGTTSPGTSKLRVLDSATTAPVDGSIKLTDNVTTTVGLSLVSHASVQTPYLYGNTVLGFGANAAERMRIDGSGNVGIGTTNPQAPLDVNRMCHFPPHI